MLLSHLCSLMEAAILSITPSQLAELRQSNPRIGRVCMNLKHDIDKPIAVILIINTAAHTIGAAVAGGSLGETFGNQYMGVFSLVFTLLMVQYTEILPKTIGVRFNVLVLRYAARPLQVAVWVLMPLIRLTHFINRPFERRKPTRPSTADEISALAALARSSQVISTRQERIIKAVPRLSERTARAVMLPVENISFLTSDQTLAEALNATGTDFHTRYPVCRKGDGSCIIGSLNVKDLLFNNQDWHRSIKPVTFISIRIPQLELIENVLKFDSKLLMVRDAQGKTVGMLTVNDVLLELLGKEYPDDAAATA